MQKIRAAVLHFFCMAPGVFDFIILLLTIRGVALIKSEGYSKKAPDIINDHKFKKRIHMRAKAIVTVFLTFVLGIALFSSMVIVESAAADTEKVWVRSSDASLKSDRKASSDTVAVLPFGSKLDVLAYENKWYKVATKDGEEGWIYRGKVSKEPVESSESGEEGLLGDLAASSISADAADSSRSMRGLSPEAKAYAETTGTSEKFQEALDQTLSRKINPGEISEFLKNGQIGEFAQ